MGYPEQGLTLRRIVRESISRAKRWHGGDISQWSTLEWAGAMCGEAGEAANAAKKLRRLELEIPSINTRDRDLPTIRVAKEAVVREVCDTILYAVLVAASAGCDPERLEEELCSVFNAKSEEYGFPERIGV